MSRRVFFSLVMLATVEVAGGSPGDGMYANPELDLFRALADKATELAQAEASNPALDVGQRASAGEVATIARAFRFMLEPPVPNTRSRHEQIQANLQYMLQASTLHDLRYLDSSALHRSMIQFGRRYAAQIADPAYPQAAQALVARMEGEIAEHEMRRSMFGNERQQFPPRGSYEYGLPLH